MPLAKVEGGPAILGKHCQSYYGNCSLWERQGMQVVTSEGRRGLFGQSGGARTCAAGARGAHRGAHRGEGRRGLRVVLKGTAPDLSHCAGAEARTKQGGGGGARREVVRAYKALSSRRSVLPTTPSPSRLRKRKQVPHPS